MSDDERRAIRHHARSESIRVSNRDALRRYVAVHRRMCLRDPNAFGGDNRFNIFIMGDV